MPIGYRRGPQYLDHQECFRLWARMSLAEAVDELARRGVQRPGYGTRPTRAGVQIAALKWMALHPDEAHAYLMELNRGEMLGTYAGFAEKGVFFQFILDRIRRPNIVSPKNYAKIIAKQEYLPYLRPDDHAYVVSGR